MKNVLMVFMMACFCLIATSSISAQNYVGQEEASIRLKTEISEVQSPFETSPTLPDSETMLKLRFLNEVLEDLPSSSSDFDAHIENVYNIITENAGAKVEFIVTEIKEEVIDLISD